MTKKKTKTTKKVAAEQEVKLAPLKPLYTDKQFKYLQVEMLEERKRLTKIAEEKRAKDLETTLTAAQGSQGDDADIANQTYEKEMIFEISSNEKETIKQIDDSLRKIQAKTYGYCEGCRKPIPQKRLKVIPYTRYCLACQTTYESYR